MKSDAENWEFYLLGDINVDLTPGITSVNAIKLQHLFDIYGLNQLSIEPTRVIDHCIRNSPGKIAKYMVLFTLQLATML